MNSGLWKAPARTLAEWCWRYPGRGYGGRFAAWLEGRELAPYDSFGNGAAMRVSPAGFLASSLDEALSMARRVTEVTHNHPEGLKGAAATAHAIFLARQGTNAGEIRVAVESAYGYDLSMTVDQIRPGYRFNETCQETVPQALVCALGATGFEDAIRNAISIGGDSDTVAAIAGLWHSQRHCRGGAFASAARDAFSVGETLREGWRCFAGCLRFE